MTSFKQPDISNKSMSAYLSERVVFNGINYLLSADLD